MAAPQFVYVDAFSPPTDVQNLCGWSGATDPEMFREAFSEYTSQFPTLDIKGGLPIQGARSMLWETVRKVLGTDTVNYPQQVGDCVSFGAKNAGEYVQFYPMLNGERREFKTIFPPYLYGCGRVLIGQGKIGGDGSLGVWQAKAVMQYGVIPTDTPGCPTYSGNVARQWGRGQGPPSQFLTTGKEHLIKSAAAVNTWDEVVSALVNGYPVTIASNVGFDMTQRSDGFHHYSTHWGHQMCIIGADNEYTEPHACILNSWGDVHGQVKDFKTGEIWPKGTLRVRKADVEAILAEKDSFAYSAFDGFPAQKLPRNVFDF